MIIPDNFNICPFGGVEELSLVLNLGSYDILANQYIKIARNKAVGNTNFTIEIRIKDQADNVLSKTAKFHFTTAPSLRLPPMSSPSTWWTRTGRKPSRRSVS